VQDVVTLSVNALFMLLIFLPAVVGGFFWRRATSRASFLSVLLGFVVTVALIPITPNTAFVPGFLVSLVVFVAGSIFSSHSASERIELTPPVDQQTAG
jgi:Na+/proline symporter